LVIVVIAIICFLMICTLAMLAIKRRQDANKIHPFVCDKGTLDHVKPPAVKVVTVGSPAAASISKLPLVPASTRVPLQDVTSGTAFRRVLPKYETSPSVVVAAKGTVENSRISTSGSSSILDKTRDGFASNYRQ
jgi:hypothetical protein